MNRYIIGKDEKAIRYDLRKEINGWSLTVSLPPRIHYRDRSAVIDWIRDYQMLIRKQHPSWVTAFRAAEEGYVLQIIKADTIREVVEGIGLTTQGDAIRDHWSRTLAHA